MTVAIFPNEGPKDYKIDPKTEVTVLFYDRLKVVANWSFEPGKMTEADADAILKRVDEALGKAKTKKVAAP